MFSWIKNKLLAWWSARQRTQRTQPQPEPEPQLEPPEWHEPHLVDETRLRLTSINRALRRRLERARKRHDKFVEPQGPEPEHHERLKPSPKQKVETVLTDVIDDPNDRIIAGEWCEGDGKGNVLYEEAEFWGEFNFRDTILDQLDRYWIYLERMKKHDPDAYGFYRELGATLLPYQASGSFTNKPGDWTKYTKEEADEYRKHVNLPPHFKQHWPAFGCCAIATNPRDEEKEMTKNAKGFRVMVPKFSYFVKSKNVPWTVQPVVGGRVYLFTVWWDRPQDTHWRRRWGIPQTFPIHINSEGKLRVLKTRVRSNGEIGPWWDWRIPHEYEEWSSQHGLDAQTHLTRLFCDLARHVEYAAYSMLRVEVQNKDHLTAVFGISPRRTAYFFQDRDVVLTQNGAKRRIFHMVRPFIDKRGVAHPAQFRGMRNFTWAGYDVRISVPGRDHFMPLEFNVATTLDPTKRPGDKWVTEAETARILHARMLQETKEHEAKHQVEADDRLRQQAQARARARSKWRKADHVEEEPDPRRE
jgi:hypothetical protein